MCPVRASFAPPEPREQLRATKCERADQMHPTAAGWRCAEQAMVQLHIRQQVVAACRQQAADVSAFCQRAAFQGICMHVQACLLALFGYNAVGATGPVSCLVEKL